ncbi:MAG: ABC transporter permease subunit [Actinomycetota bacterium]
MTARIHDRGHRSYDGARLGARHSVWVLFQQGVWRVAGRRRPIWSKLLFALTLALAYLPAIVFVGLAALLNDDDLRDLVLPTYGEYYGFVTAAIVLFAAIVAPELLCTDRKSGMLGLYLASPLSRDSYMFARAMAVAAVMALVTLGPPLLLLIALTLQGAGPDGLGDTLLVFVRVVGAGIGVAAPVAALTLAVSATTDRRAAASAGIILGLLVSSAVANILLESADAPDIVGLFDLFGLPFEVAIRIHGETSDLDVGLGALSTAAVIGGAIAWTVIFGLFARWRYQRLEVRR